MNEENHELCCRIIDPAYVSQGIQARKTRENLIHHLLEQVCDRMPYMDLYILYYMDFSVYVSVIPDDFSSSLLGFLTCPCR